MLDCRAGGLDLVQAAVARHHERGDRPVRRDEEIAQLAAIVRGTRDRSAEERA
jgi:hypothetical protein